VPQLDLTGRVAVVTGAGNGLGRSHALALAARGAQVVVNDLGGGTDGTGSSSTPAQAVVDEIVAAGGQAVAEGSSVATPDGARAVVQRALDAFGSVDVVVNNAGVLRDRSIAKLTEEDYDIVLGVHLKGTFLVSQAAFPHMKDRGYGRLVHTTSAAGLFGNFGQANYSAAKMGIVGLSRTLSLEGAKAGITSNVVAPIAKTRLVGELLGPLADVLVPEQVTSLVTLLASEACPVSGEVFSVIGGRYARVFTAVTPGWSAGPRAVPEPEDLLTHLEEIRKEDGYLVPAQAFDEIDAVLPLLQGGTS
jgi:NAD(P)-dependent dehydrogenase (short-subunit alcohol dehydrogenase family)